MKNSLEINVKSGIHGLVHDILISTILPSKLPYIYQGPVVRKVDKVIHRIATFSNVLKLLVYWNGHSV